MKTTENKPQHTQGEWEVHGNGIFAKGKSQNIAIVTRQNCDLNSNGTLKVEYETEANAQRIVKCVNMHDELVGALKRLKTQMENSDPEFNDPSLNEILEKTEQK